MVHEGREHEVARARRDRAAGRAELLETHPERGEALRPVPELFHGEPGEHRLRVALDGLLAVGERVALLEQEPLAVLAAHPREHPLPAELDPVELELELATLHLLGRGPVAEGAVRAAVPDDGRPGAVAALGDHALEVAVLERMVLDVHGQALLAVPDRRPLRHGPAREHTAELEPEVVVEPAGRVLVHDEQVARRGAAPAEGLGRPLRVTLFAVCVERAPSHGVPAAPRATRRGCRRRAPRRTARGFPSSRKPRPRGRRSRRRSRTRAPRSRARARRSRR